MTRVEFLQTLEREHRAWEAAIARLSEAQLTRPVVGTWTARDVIAHVTWFEREMIDVVRERALVGSDLWRLRQDERNAILYEQNRHRPASEVLAESRAVWAELFPLLQGLSEVELNTPAAFREMPPNWIPWNVIAGNTYEHYVAHIDDLSPPLASEARPLPL